MKSKIATAGAAFTASFLFASHAFASVCVPFIGCFGGGGGDGPAPAPEIDATGILPVAAIVMAVGAIAYRRNSRS